MKIIYNKTDNVMFSPTPVGEFRIMINMLLNRIVFHDRVIEYGA